VSQVRQMRRVRIRARRNWRGRGEETTGLQSFHDINEWMSHLRPLSR